MIEQIAALVKQFSRDAVVNNPEVPDSQNNEVMAEATTTITSGLQNMLAGGGLQNIISMFTGKTEQDTASTQSSGIAGLLKNPIVLMMVGHLVSKLVSKYKMSPAQANQVSSNVIPNVLNSLVTRTNSNEAADKSFDLNDLLSSLTGGRAATPQNSNNGFDFQGLLQQITSGGNGGGAGLQDIISRVTQGAQENRVQESTGGGVADLIRGFFR